MAIKSSGVLLYRLVNKITEVFLVHPGGPFFAKKDLGVWSIPKGEFTDDEDPLTAAKREFHEETGVLLEGEFKALAAVKQKSGKIVYAWAVKGSLDETQIRCNLFEMEWPPKSGRKKLFPEIDKGAWFSTEVARQKIIAAQAAFIDELVSL